MMFDHSREQIATMAEGIKWHDLILKVNCAALADDWLGQADKLQRTERFTVFLQRFHNNFQYFSTMNYIVTLVVWSSG